MLTDGIRRADRRRVAHGRYRLAAALRQARRRGGRPGPGVQLPNWNEFVVVYVALARIGAVLVPTMPIYRHDEARYVLQHSGAKIAVVPGEFRGFDYPDMLGEIRASAPGLPAAPIPEVMLRGWSQRCPGCALLSVYGRSEGLLVTACTTGDSAEHVHPPTAGRSPGSC